MASETKRTRKASANGNGGGKWIRPERRLAIYLRDGFCCAYCGSDLHGARPFDVTLDHLNCTHEAGHHHESNLVTACRSCNSRRQDTPLRYFANAATRQAIRKSTRRNLRRYVTMAKALIKGEAR